LWCGEEESLTLMKKGVQKSRETVPLNIAVQGRGRRSYRCRRDQEGQVEEGREGGHTDEICLTKKDPTHPILHEKSELCMAYTAERYAFTQCNLLKVRNLCGLYHGKVCLSAL
jgi:hypothetical protein